MHLLPDWLVTLAPKPVWLGMLCGVVVAGLCGWVIGRISFKVRGAYFVIVTVSFAEVRPPGRAQLGGADAGADGAQQHPAAALGMPGLFELLVPAQARQLLPGAGRRRAAATC